MAKTKTVDKTADTTHELQQKLIPERWSPRAFDPERPVPAGDLAALFEAARWAPSSFNDQPWAFVVARREDGAAWRDVLDCLVTGNQQWAQLAPVLGVSLARTHFSGREKENDHAWHDVGAAMAYLTMEATARDLYVHQMAGIRRDAVRETLELPATWEPVAAFAIGYRAEDLDDLPEKFHDSETAERSRQPLRQFVFSGTFGQTADFVEPDED